jgi:hypothetical protein
MKYLAGPHVLTINFVDRLINQYIPNGDKNYFTIPSHVLACKYQEGLYETTQTLKAVQTTRLYVTYKYNTHCCET